MSRDELLGRRYRVDQTHMGWISCRAMRTFFIRWLDIENLENTTHKVATTESNIIQIYLVAKRKHNK